MRVLLLSANTGEGHNSTARAIMEVLEEQGGSCELLDTLSFLSPRFSKFICSWHTRLYKYGHKLMDAGYRAMERTADPEESSVAYGLLRLGTGKLWETLLAGKYDAVVCVHVFSAMMMTELRRVLRLKIPCFFVATDYTCSPTVEKCDMDGYFIPAPELAEEFTRVGLTADRLIPSGIPVGQAFYTRGDRDAARMALGLEKEALVVLLMCGSMGCGPISKIARELAAKLPEGATVVAICGNNERLRETLQDADTPGLQVVGYTTKISQYMDAADMIVTKPGGLSSTEAANKHLPMVLINAVGGCESRNFSYFLNRGYGVGSTEAEEVVTLALDLAANREKRVAMTQRLTEAFDRNSAKTIARQVATSAAAYRQEKKAQAESARIEQAGFGNPLSNEGGWNMDNANKITVSNLARSFAGEAQARTRYTIYAGIARKEGYEWIARIFEQTAANEAVHAEEFLEHLHRLGGCCDNISLNAGYPFQIGTTAENLAFAAQGEREEHDNAYPEFAEGARREGFDDTARLWMQIARIEGVHHNTFRQLHEQFVRGTLTEKADPVSWRCLHCGYTYEGIRACDPCPVCGKEAGWQQGQVDEKMLMPKKSRQ